MRSMVIGFLCCSFLACGARAQSAPATSVEQKILHPPGAYATVNGAKLWYESEGSGEPLLLIAGGPGDAHYFHPYFSTMASSVRVISFDAFGRGKSDRAKSPTEYTFSRDVEDVEGLRKALGLGKIALLGHSYGGMVAQAYALKYPEHLTKLILADTLYSGEMWQANNDSCNYELRNQFPEMWDKVQELRSAGLHSSAKEHQKAYELPDGLLYFHDASIAEKLPKEANDTNTDVYYAIVGDDGDFLIGGDIAALDFRTQLKTLKMPTLIVTGRYDRVALPRFAVQFKKYAPQAQFVMFERSGHLPFIEEPEEFFKLLREFLAANPN
jgi:proline iminopeptidase